MASQTRQAKVLRIGIIQDGKIVQERLIKAGEPVTVGESAKNTFVFTKTHLGSPEHTLFKASGNGYILQFTEKMKGKISSGGAVVALQKLASDPSVSKKDGLILLPLTQQDRGKISIDSVTVLFQFVAPPPVHAVTPMQQMDFRPRLLEDDDPVFLGFLAIWSALATVLVIWVWNAEPQEYTLQDLPDRFVKVVMPKKDIDPPELEVEPDPDAEGEAIEKEADPSKNKAKADDKPKDKVEQAKQEQKTKEQVLEKSKLLAKLIGTRGESATTAADLWSDEDKGLGDIDGALENAGGVATDAASAGPRKGAGGDGEAAGIDDLKGPGGGTAGDVGGPAVKIEGTVSTGSGEIDALDGDSSAAQKVIRKYAGQLNYCYERRLKASPGLAGRVEFSWYVEAGKVSNVLLVANTTGDAELVDCIKKKISRWAFSDDFEGDVSYPFIFQPK